MITHTAVFRRFNRYHEKRLFAALTILLLAYAIGPDAGAACPPYTKGKLETVATVVDGDTLTLASGVKVRLAGIDTSELGHGLEPDAPGAQSGKKLLARLIGDSSNKIRLETAKDAHDHYGRLIAYTYSSAGTSIQEQILRSGWALGYARPPNLGYLDCYREAETAARKQRLGLWRIPATPVDDLSKSMRGFKRVTGKVLQINRTGESVWVEMGEKFAIRIAQEDVHYFSAVAFEQLVGHTLEARGYLNTYRRQIQMRIRHPVDWRVVN